MKLIMATSLEEQRELYDRIDGIHKRLDEIEMRLKTLEEWHRDESKPIRKVE